MLKIFAAAALAFSLAGGPVASAQSDFVGQTDSTGSAPLPWFVVLADGGCGLATHVNSNWGGASPADEIERASNNNSWARVDVIERGKYGLPLGVTVTEPNMLYDDDGGSFQGPGDRTSTWFRTGSACDAYAAQIRKILDGLR